VATCLTVRRGSLWKSNVDLWLGAGTSQRPSAPPMLFSFERPHCGLERWIIVRRAVRRGFADTRALATKVAGAPRVTGESAGTPARTLRTA